jgi:hypothetical protein
LDAALSLVSAKQCETLTGCKVNELYNNMMQVQDTSANALYMLQPPPAPVVMPIPTKQPPPPQAPVQPHRRY